VVAAVIVSSSRGIGSCGVATAVVVVMAGRVVAMCGIRSGRPCNTDSLRLWVTWFTAMLSLQAHSAHCH